MKRAVLLALLLSGCVTAAEREARFDSADDARCQGYGAKAGTDAYVNCRVQMSNQRASLRAARAADGPTTCTRSGNTTFCN